MTISPNSEQSRPQDKDETPIDSGQLSQTSLNALDTIRDEPHLRRAFEQFSEQSMRLEEAYNTLEAQFRQVSAQLHEVYSQLDGKMCELATAKHYQEVLLSKMWQGVLFIARDRTILTCNQTMSKWLNVENEDLNNLNFEAKVPDNFFGFSIKSALEASQGPQICYTEANGEKNIPALEITTNFITFDNGNVEGDQFLQDGLCIMARDLSEVHQKHVGDFAKSS